MLDLEGDIFSLSRTDIIKEYNKVDPILRCMVPEDFLNDNYSIEFIACYTVASNSKGYEDYIGKSLNKYSFNKIIAEFNLDSYATRYRYNDSLIFLEESLEDIVS